MLTIYFRPLIGNTFLLLIFFKKKLRIKKRKEKTKRKVLSLIPIVISKNRMNKIRAILGNHDKY